MSEIPRLTPSGTSIARTSDYSAGTTSTIRQDGIFADRRYRMRARRRRELRHEFGERAKARFSRLHALQPVLVRPRQIWSDAWRREDQQPGAVACFAAADQWCDGSFGHAVLHGEPGRPVQGVGCFRDVRLYAEAIHHVPMGVRSPRGKRAVFRRAGRNHADFLPRQRLWWKTSAGHRAQLCRDSHRDLQKIENRIDLSILVKF
jgi:hypothetical protein